jgi:hypothetical protein
MSRLTDSINYIKAIPVVRQKALAVERHAGRVGAARLVQEWLKFPIGVEEKIKSLVPILGNTKDENYRKAARTLLLLNLLYDYHGDGPVNDFLTRQRQRILAIENEQTIKTEITNKLCELASVPITTAHYRVYDERSSTGQVVLCSAYSVDGRQSGRLRSMLNARGTWLHHPMAYEPASINFAEKPYIEGLYTLSASGGCIVVAFLYGGKKGQPLKGASLVHIPGGDYDKIDWSDMKVGDKQPSSIVVFLSTHNLTNIDNETRRALELLTEKLNYSEQLILFHICEYVNHGVDKWGHFGSAFAPDGKAEQMGFKTVETSFK